jgi:uncharacterized protein with GYD domain
MATYLALLKFTPQGLQNVHESPHRATAFKAAAKKAGVKITQTLWTLGAYDGALLFEAPNDTVVASLMIALAGLGNVQATTLRAFNAAEFATLVEKLPRL